MTTAEKITLDDDWMICLCGNDPSLDGFFSCLGDGTPVEPADLPGLWDGRRYVCARCGRIVDYQTQEVTGRRDDIQALWAAGNAGHKITGWALQIMNEIRSDMREPFPWGKQIPRNVGSFSLLHDYCDANMLLETDPALMALAVSGSDDDMAVVNAVLNVVNAFLAAEAKQISDLLAAGEWHLDYGVIDEDLLAQQRAHWTGREAAGGYRPDPTRPQASGELTVGQRVKVARRGGITGVIDGFSTDNTVTPPKPLASITFDDGGPGLNYTGDCEPVPYEQQPRSWQERNPR